ncbi:methyl-accepting chemotaxis protein [Virgibacillus oceani]|uniref:Sensory transducer protein YvaQ n=1 Tax=Virgibacillus oceani TaxID=1479511 RepID=A0A917HNP4_9BACI|nr:methyl-accepting chemotaxis protein [Virgibacillus oceani]GGG84666.1 putative sensory transducer protein YvaQ [Virgibacillus oceani]
MFNSIKRKILFGFSIVVLLVILLGFYNYLAIKAINDNISKIVDDQVPLLITSEKIALNMSERTSLVRGYLLYGDTDLKTKFDSFTDESIQLENKVLKLDDSDGVKDLVEKKIVWAEAINSVFKEYDTGNKEKAMEIMVSEVKPLEREILDGFKAMAAEQETVQSHAGEDITSYGNTSLLIDIGISIIIAVMAIIAAIKTASHISKPIVTVKNRMKVIAEGDLRQELLETTSKDEIGQLVHAANDMNQHMRSLLNQINEVSGTVSSQSEELTQAANEVRAGTGQVATTMEELASGSETQANSAGDMANIMGTFTNKVEEANNYGERILNNSEKVLQMTTKGGQLMNASAEQMDNINGIVKDAVDKVQNLDNQSKEISKLVSIIKDVAEQTNLLSLNAAIEAARAGEHGKGFAVVADEVRKLSEQVALSVKDITEIVITIQTESNIVADSLLDGYSAVEQGTVQMESTNEMFNDIRHSVTEMVESIKVVSGNLSEIESNSREMNGSIEEIASVSEEAAAGIEETAASAQQSSSSMEEIAGSSAQLAKLAEELNEKIGKFKL